MAGRKTTRRGGRHYAQSNTPIQSSATRPSNGRNTNNSRILPGRGTTNIVAGASGTSSNMQHRPMSMNNISVRAGPSRGSNGSRGGRTLCVNDNRQEQTSWMPQLPSRAGSAEPRAVGAPGILRPSNPGIIDVPLQAREYSPGWYEEFAFPARFHAHPKMLEHISECLRDRLSPIHKVLDSEECQLEVTYNEAEQSFWIVCYKPFQYMVVDALRQLINDKLLQAGLRAGVRSTLSRNIWASTRGEHLDRQTYHNPVYPCNSSSRFVFEGIWSSRVFGKYAVDVVPEPTAEELSRNLGVSLKFNISGSTIFIGSNSSEEAVAEAIRRIDVLSAYYTKSLTRPFMHVVFTEINTDFDLDLVYPMTANGDLVKTTILRSDQDHAMYDLLGGATPKLCCLTIRPRAGNYRANYKPRYFFPKFSSSHLSRSQIKSPFAAFHNYVYRAKQAFTGVNRGGSLASGTIAVGIHTRQGETDGLSVEAWAKNINPEACEPIPTDAVDAPERATLLDFEAKDVVDSPGPSVGQSQSRLRELMGVMFISEPPLQADSTGPKLIDLDQEERVDQEALGQKHPVISDLLGDDGSDMNLLQAPLAPTVVADERDKRKYYETMRQKAPVRALRAVPAREALEVDFRAHERQVGRDVELGLDLILESKRVWAGPLELNVKFGRLFLKKSRKINDEMITTAQDFDAAAAVPGCDPQALLRRLNCMPPEDVVFCPAVSLFGGDANALVKMKDATKGCLWKAKDTQRKIFYEFSVSMHRDDALVEFVVIVDESDWSTRIQPIDRTQGSVYVHCPQRMWDFCFTIEGHAKTWQVPEYKEAAANLVDAMAVSTSEGLPVVQIKLPNDCPFEVQDLQVRHVAPYENSNDPSCLMQMSMVFAMDFERRQESSHRYVINAKKTVDDTANGFFTCWYEVSLSSAKVMERFQQNQHIQLGQETSWTSQDLKKEGVYKSLYLPACAIIREMDNIGAKNRNHRARVLDAADVTQSQVLSAQGSSSSKSSGARHNPW